MRIAVVSERLDGRSDEGIKSVALALIRELSREHQVLALSGRGPGEEGVHVRVAMNAWFLNRELHARARRFDADAVLYVPWTSGTARTFLRARVLGLGASAPVAVMLTQPYRGPLWERRLSRLLRPHLVLAMSDETLAAASELGAPAEFVPAGVDLARFDLPGAEERDAARRRLGLAAGERVILHVGHLNASRMDPEEMSRIAGRPGFRLVVVGSPDTPQDRELIRWLEEAGALVLREFVPGIASIYGAADVYLFPTRNPRSCIGVPLSVLEALACGIPVVSTPFQGLPRLFRDTPFVRFAATSAEMEAALAEAPAPGQAGARALVEPLDWPRVALAVGELLRGLARDRPAMARKPE